RIEMNEIWKDIKGFEGIYQASPNGYVKSLGVRYNNGEVILKGGLTRSGYLTIVLCKNKKRYNKLIHRIIAETFLGLSEKQVNHKNGIKTDNRLENLEWVTRSQNSRHAIDTGLFVPNFDEIAIKKRKPVIQLTLDTNKIVNTYNSA